MGNGFSLKCTKCTYETEMLMLGGGMLPIYRYCDNVLYSCPDCKKMVVIEKYCSLKKFKELAKESGLWSNSPELTEAEKKEVEKAIIKQKAEGVMCPECGSANVKRVRKKDKFICPKCGELMEHGDTG